MGSFGCGRKCMRDPVVFNTAVFASRKAEVLGELGDPGGLVHLIREDVEKKSDTPVSRIGFAAGH